MKWTLLVAGATLIVALSLLPRFLAPGEFELDGADGGSLVFATMPESPVVAVARAAVTDATVGTDITVLDAVSRRPLEAVTVHTDHGSVVRTAPNGTATGVRTASRRETVLRLELPDGLGGATFEHRLPPTPGDGSVTVSIPAYSRLRLTITAADGGAIGARVKVLPRPELPDGQDPGTSGRVSAARGDPIARVRTAKRLRVTFTDFAVESDLDEGDTVDVDAPADGPVSIFISAFDPTVRTDSGSLDERRAFVHVPVVATARLTRGVVTHFCAEVRRKPVVRGRVVDEHDRPVAGVDVTVAVKTRSSEDDPMLRAEREPWGPSYVLIAANGAIEHDVVAQLTRRTDAEGRFSVAMPWTDSVAAWTFCRGSRLAYAEARSGSRFAAPEDLVLRLSPPTGSPPAVRLVDRQGRSLAGLRVQPAEFRPAHEFQLLYPVLETDVEGRLDISWLRERRHWVFFIEDGSGATFEADVEAGRVITVDSAR